MKIPRLCSVFATAGSPENGESAVVFSHFCDPGLFLEDIDIEVELLGLVEQNGPHLFFSVIGIWARTRTEMRVNLAQNSKY